MTKGPLELVSQVAAILDDLEVLYALGGSMASSLIAEPRSTVDVDIAIKVEKGTNSARSRTQPTTRALWLDR